MRWTLLGFGFYPHVLQFIANHHQPGILSSTRIERKPFDKESLAWLCSKYYTSAEYQQLSERTRYVRRATLDHICAADGEKPYKLLLPKHIRARRDARADRPESANGMIKALRQVFAFALENDYVVSNPQRNPCRT